MAYASMLLKSISCHVEVITVAGSVESDKALRLLQIMLLVGFKSDWPPA